MSLHRSLVLVAALAAFATACSDAPTERGLSDHSPSLFLGEGVLHRYVAIGTSVSMGVASDGVYAGSQESSWPAQLARLGNRELSQPYIEAPGCGAPLIGFIAANRRLSGEPAAGVATNDRICAPLEEGITLPTHNVAVDGARTLEALLRVPDATDRSLRGRQYLRVLPPGESQVTAAVSLNPKMVSVELGANDLLGARSGIWLPGVTVVPVAEWKAQYSQVVTAVSGAKHVLLTGLISDAMDFPGFRTGAELYAARATFAPFNVLVGEDCGTINATNVLFVPVRVAAAAGEGAKNAANRAGPYTMNCFNAPSATRIEDYVLTAGEIGELNAALAEMNAFIRAQAAQNGFAYFELEELYGVVNVKAPFNAIVMMTSPTPFGPYISLDGFHPTAEGSRILANAAARALNETYRMGLGQSSVVTRRPLVN